MRIESCRTATVLEENNMDENVEKHLDEIEIKISNATLAERKEIAENMQYFILQHMSTKVQNMIFNALK